MILDSDLSLFSIFMPFINTGNKRNKESYYSYMFISNTPFILSKDVTRILLVLNVMFSDSTRNLIRTCFVVSGFMGLGHQWSWVRIFFCFDSAPSIPLLLVSNNGKISSYS